MLKSTNIKFIKNKIFPIYKFKKIYYVQLRIQNCFVLYKKYDF